jgi:hypothetical protein
MFPHPHYNTLSELYFPLYVVIYIPNGHFFIYMYESIIFLVTM